MLFEFNGGIGTGAGVGWLRAFSTWLAYPWPATPTTTERPHAIPFLATMGGLTSR